MFGRRILHEPDGHPGRATPTGAVGVNRTARAMPAATGMSSAAGHQRRGRSERDVKGPRRPIVAGVCAASTSPLIDVWRGSGDRVPHVNRRREPIASTWNRGDVDRLPRVVAQRSAQNRDAVREAVVRHERVGPHQLHQFLFFHDPVVAPDQDRQRFERLTGQRKASPSRASVRVATSRRNGPNV